MNGHKFPVREVRVACKCGPDCGYVPDEGIWFVAPDARVAEELKHGKVCSGKLRYDEMLSDGRYPLLLDTFFNCDGYGELPLVE